MAQSEITRAFLSSSRTAINKHLAALGKELGVKFSAGSCRFDHTLATFKLEMVLQNKETKGKSASELKAEAAWIPNAAAFGLKKEWLGQKIQSARFGEVTIIGLAPRRTRFPVVCKAADGGQIIVAPETIISQLGKKRK